MQNCRHGVEQSPEQVDSLVTIPNDRILSIIDRKAPFLIV